MKYLHIILLSIYIISIQAYAHPHMFVDVQPYLLSIKNNKVIIHAKWYFDEFTSEGFLMDYDENQNGKLDSIEKNAIKKDFGQSLKKFEYFIKSKFNGKKVKPRISNFKITTLLRDSRKGGKVNIVSYKFDIEIRSKFKKENHLSLLFYDMTIFSVLYPMKKIIPKKGIHLKSNKLTKSKCLFEVVF